MTYRGFRLCCYLAMFSGLGAIAATQGVVPPRHDPFMVFEIAAAARRAPGSERNARLASLLKEAGDSYRTAAFSGTIDLYNDALKIAPDRTDIRTLKQIAVDSRNLQREARKALPRTSDERESFLELTYDQARAYYRQRDYSRAYEAFYTLWLSAGDYRNSLRLMEKARAKGKIESPAVPTSPKILAGANPNSATRVSRTAEQIDLEKLWNEGARALRLAEPERAQEAFNRILAIDPNHAEARRGAAQARAEIERSESETLRLKIDDLLLRAQIESQRDNFSGAKDLYRQASLLEPGNRVVERGLVQADAKLEESRRQEVAAIVQTSMSSGRVFAAQKNWAGARQSYRQVLETLPGHEPAERALAELEITIAAETKARQRVRDLRSAALSQSESAERVETAGVALSPTSDLEADAPTARQVAMLQDENEPPNAKELEKQRKAEMEKRVDELVAMAKAALKNKDFDGAKKNYEEVLKLEPKNRAAIKGIAKTEQERAKGEKRAREEEIAKLLKQGDVHLRNSRFSEAKLAYESVQKLDGKNRASRKGLEKVAKSEAEVAQRSHEAQLAAALKQGEDALKSNQFDQARAAYRAARELEPNNRRAARGLEAVDRMVAEQRSRAIENANLADLQAARAQVDQKNFDVARATLGRVLDRSPGNRAATRELRRLTSAEAAAADAAAAAERGDSQRAMAAVARAQAQPQRPPQSPPQVSPPSPDPPRASRQIAQSSQRELEAATSRRARQVRRDLERNRESTIRDFSAQADRAYERGEIEIARERWNDILALDPENKRAQTFLEETEVEYEDYRNQKDQAEKALERTRAREALLESPVTIQTERPMPLSEFMRLVSFSTVSELEYYLADGADTPVFVNFVDKPLDQVLDATLGPLGLNWEVDENNLFTIQSEVFSNTFNLTTDQMNKIRSLMDSRSLQRIIWGQEEPPSRGVEMNLDERQAVLILVGTRIHLDKMEDFISALDTAARPELETALYKIRAEDGPKIRALVEAMIESDVTTPFEFERKVFLDGSDLIIRDTPENIIKIEELLLDEDFIQGLREEELGIINFSLIPRDVENIGSDEITVLTQRVVESIKTLLYARTGESAANQEGRRMWFDQATLQLTIVDLPSNLERIGRYIDSLPELRHEQLNKVIHLDFAIAESLATELSNILNLVSVGGSAAGGGEAVTRRLRRGEEFTFRGLKIRLIRVEDGDPQDRNDDEAELSINTGTQSSSLTVRELDTVFFEDYEIFAEDVQPSGSGEGTGSNRGEGIVRLTIRYVEPIQVGAQPVAAPAEPGPSADASPGLTITAFGPLNALIVRYDNPAQLREVENLVVQLDEPTPQVQVEVRFVQVNESRAREFSADFNLENVINGRNFNTDFHQFNTRFAQDLDEFRNTFEPPIENPLSANLLKGTTIIDLVLGSGVPGLGFQLRMLEAEGIINITNGPKVTMLDGVQGEFRFEKLAPLGSGQQQGVFQQNDIFSPFSQQQGQDTLREEDGSQFQNRVSSVILLVTPQITSIKSIIFTIIAELLDFDTNVGIAAFPTNQGGGGAGTGNLLGDLQFPSRGRTDRLVETIPDAQGQTLNFIGPGVLRQAIFNQGDLLRARKLIDTTARTEDGGTIVLGGWTGERTQELTSGIPVLRNMPYVGKLFFSRNQRSMEKTTLLIFLTANLLD